MRKRVAALVVIVFLAASSMLAASPAFSSTQIAENTWVSKAPMHVARSSLGVAVVNDKIYAMGGFVGNGVLSGANEEYDPETDTWTFKAPMPIPSSGFVTAVYQGEIYCLGNGINEVYNPASDKWENRTPTAIPVAQANVLNGAIYLLGGYPNRRYPNTTLNEAYDPRTDNWTMKAPMPKASSAASVVYENKIYVMGTYTEGGYFESDDNYIPLHRTPVMQIYDPETDTWSSNETAGPNSMGQPFATVTSGIMAPKRIYLFYTPLDAPSGFVYKNQVYDPDKQSWIDGVGIPTNRAGFGIAIVNDLIYVIGGCSHYYPDLFSWSAGPTVIFYSTNEVYTPFGYGTVPPNVQVVSLVNNAMYYGAGVVLNFTLNKPASWVGYSLDGQDNVTVTGNVTLAGLSDGWHNVTVYAEDSLGNTGASETIVFNVASPFPTVPVAVVSGASAIAIGIGLLVYFKKRKP